jgi:general secretion pathway protein J
MTSVQRFTVRGWIPGQGWIATPFPTSGTPITGLELSVDRAVPGGVERYSRVVAFQ